MTITNKVSLKSVMAGNTPIPDVPDAPTIGSISDPGTDGYASVAFTAAATGGTVTTYTATSTPGSITGTSATSPITVTGLTLNTAYTFKVKGTNSTATGPESSSSSLFTPTAHTSYESIATVTVGSGGTSTITFSSIPSTYTDLQIRYSSTANTGSNFFINFNSDTTTGNYKNHKTTGYGYAIDADSADNRLVGITQSSYPGVGVVDILDYTNTNKYKTTRFLSGSDGNGGTRRLQFGSVLWMSTSVISALQLVCDGTIQQYSKFSLYGIKA